MTDITPEEIWRKQMDLLNEKQKRLFAAYEVKTLGYGGISRFARATGISRETIHQGIREIESGRTLQGERIRKTGGGRKKATVQWLE